MRVGQEQQDSLKGQILVATPIIEEPIFRRTVILLLEHNPDGALGVVLNRPSPVPVDAALEKWAPLALHPSVVFTGGPMDTDSAVGLAQIRPESTSEMQLFKGRVGVIDLSDEPSSVSKEIMGLRIYSGYAGWGSGQLEAELNEDAWWVLDLNSQDVSTQEPSGLWHQVLRRQSGKVAWFANYPDDPESN